MPCAFNGTDAYLELASSIVTTFPCSILAWIARDGTVADDVQMWVMQGQSNADRYLAMMQVTATGSANNKRGVVRNPGDSWFASAPSDAADVDATMRLGVAVFTSTTSRRFYWAAADKFQDDTATATNDLSNHDRIVIGGRRYNSGGFAQPTNGALAEVHFYNAAITQANVTSILGGTLPEAISGWVDGWTLLNASSLTSIGGTRTLTLNGGVTTSGKTHPVTRSGGGGGLSVVPRRTFFLPILNH